MSFDDLRIIRRIGRSSAGDVLLTVDQNGVEHALKKIQLDQIPRSVAEQQERGLALQATLHAACPAVVQTRSWKRSENVLFIKLEHVEGESLAELLQKGPISEKWIIDIAIQICEALETCHALPSSIESRAARGIFHGDLRPQSVRLELGQRVRLTSYGFYFSLPPERLMIDSPPAAWAYYSPERLQTGAVNATSDLWSLGITLYKMITGALPFFSDSPDTLRRMILRGEVPPLRKCSLQLAEVVHQALAEHWADRFQSAEEFRLALEDVRGALGQGSAAPLGAKVVGFRPPRPTRTVHLQPAQIFAGGSASSDAGEVYSESSSHSPVFLPARETSSWENESSQPEPEWISRESFAPVAEDDPRKERRSEPRQSPTGDPDPRELKERRSEPRTENSRRSRRRGSRSGGGGSSSRRDATRRPTLNSATPIQLPVTRRRLKKGAGFTLLLLLLVAIGAQLFAWSRIGGLQESLLLPAAENVDDSWSRYALIRRCMTLPWGPGLAEAETTLANQLQESAETVIQSYHDDIPATVESDWRRAEIYLKNALSIDDGNSVARAERLYCQGHLYRLESTAMTKAAPAEAMVHRSEAVERFGRAAQVAPEWADPYLGLARIHSNERFDLEELERALFAAEDRGYAMGSRERAQLADGYHREAKSMFTEAQQSEDPFRRKELRERSMLMANRATHLYSTILGFAEAERNRYETSALVTKLKKLPATPD